jgi:fibro-slime domain-containing protein
MSQRPHVVPAFLLLAASSGTYAGCGPAGEPATSETQNSGSQTGGTTFVGAGGTAGVASGGSGEIVVMPSGGSDGTGGAQEGPTVTIIRTLPTGFTPADVERPETSRGGYQVLGPLADVPPPEGECANILRIIARDFAGTHDDFDNAADWSAYEVLSPIDLATRKPTKSSDNGPLHLEEWYLNLEGINLPFAVDLWLEPLGDTFVFDSAAFFPLSDWGNMDAYFFSTELHTNFQYKGGEVFTFRGDDDVLVYINGHIGVNLSGVHTAQEGSVVLDEVALEFGLTVGNVYTFDLFQAERQASESNFRLETTLDFTGCGEILPVDIVVK